MASSEFITRIASFAVADMQRSRIAASLTIAQAALESGWGTSGLTQKANNLFGIKGSGRQAAWRFRQRNTGTAKLYR